MQVRALYPRFRPTCQVSVNSCAYFLQFLPAHYRQVETPESADLHILFDSYDGTAIRDWSLNEVLHPSAVMYSQAPDPTVVLPGVYVNLRRDYAAERARTHGYISYLAETGGNPYCRGVVETPKSFLFCFLGRNCHLVRNFLFRCFGDCDDVCVQDTSGEYNHWSGLKDGAAQAEFVTTIRRSCFSICPRGVGTNSIRLFESMRLGVAPVIVSDSWPVPSGPDWDNFSIRVPEKDVQNLYSILQAEKHRADEMGKLARKAYENYFSPATMTASILDQLEIMAAASNADQLLRLRGLMRLRSRRAYWVFYRLLLSGRDAVRSIASRSV